MRLDKALVQHHPHLSRAQAKDLIHAQRVRVNQRVVTKASHAIYATDSIVIDGELPVARTPIAEPNPDIVLSIMHEDSAIVVLHKPSGLSVHPSQHHPNTTLVNGMLAQWPHLATPLIGEDPLRPGIVHRLDKDTSGVMVIAKTQDAYAALKHQFQSRTVQKTYIALVHGTLKEDSGVIDTPIGRSTADPRKLTADPSLMHIPKPSITHWRVQQRFEGFTLLELTPKTGRTHQLRVHLQSIHHPIAGDVVYSSSQQQEHAATHGVSRLCLHASSLTVEHPESHERITFHAPLPQDLQQTLDNLSPHALA